MPLLPAQLLTKLVQIPHFGSKRVGEGLTDFGRRSVSRGGLACYSRRSDTPANRPTKNVKAFPKSSASVFTLGVSDPQIRNCYPRYEANDSQERDHKKRRVTGVRLY